MTVSAFDGVDKKAKPVPSLLQTVKKNAGRNSYGRITVRHRGGGNKRKYRIIDFRRDKMEMPAVVQRLEYDPNRSAFIALVKYEDGELRYILAPVGLKAGDTVVSSASADIKPGNCLPIANIPVGTIIHNIELYPGRGAQLVRSAGAAAQLMAKDAELAQVRLPSGEVLEELNPALKEMLPHLFTETHTSDTKAGELTPEWADRLGLPQGIAVAVGALDAHMGAVGASVAPGILTRIMGTSTCDIMVAGKDEVGGRCIKGICGQVDGSVLPGFIGFEAGQSAFGDIYAWFRKMLAWTLKDIPGGEARQKVLDGMLVELTREAQDMEPSEDGVVALDWMNGRRTPDADQNVKGAVAGLTLGTSAPEIFRALVEATAFGSRRIVEHMKGQGLRIDSVNAIGGISKKAPFVMQTLADVLDMPIRVVRSEQTCALGAAMFAAVAAGVYKDINEATRHMESDIEAEYRPDEKRALIYEKLYKKYLELAKLAETIN